MIRGAALIPKIAKETTTNPARINLPSFPLTLRFETFRDSNGILLTIINDNMTVKTINNIGEPVNELKIAEWE